jgi:hypothetical protein
LKKGVVKIDVEGLDGHMIDQLIASLPSDFSLMVFFENRDENQTAEGFIQNHPSVDVIYRMTSSGSVSHRLPRWLRSILMWWKDDEKIILSQVQGRLGIGDFIFSVG